MTSPAWHISGVSVQGTSHLEKNIPCQDIHGYRLTAGGELLLAIADGAGSAERSQEGAQAAVIEAITSLEAALEAGVPGDEAGWQALIAQAFAAARQSVVELAASDNALLRSFATTLACAVVSGDWLAVGQIGDGAAIAEDMDGMLFLTARPQRGEYANEAYFLTMPDGLKFLTVYTARRFIRSLALTTDGLLRLAFKLPEYEPSAKFFQPLLAFTAAMDSPEKAQLELAAFLTSARVCARTDDDKTLVLATRAPPIPTQPGYLPSDGGRGG
jgi:uncharacterized MAPEG superfamily protein